MIAMDGSGGSFDVFLGCANGTVGVDRPGAFRPNLRISNGLGAVGKASGIG